MSNVPPEPDEFQTRMRQPDPNEDVESTNQSSRTPAAQEPAQPPAPAPAPAPAPQSPFAPPGFGAPSQPATPPAQPATPPAQAAPPTQGYGQQQGAYSQPPTQVFGQPPGQPGQPGQQSFGAQSQPQQGAGYQQVHPVQPGAGWNLPPQPPRDASPVKAAFDLSFNAYATPGIVKIVYVVGIVLTALGWIISVIAAFALGAPRDVGMGFETEGTVVPGILALIFGWIPGAFFILLLRVALELTLSSVRTAMDVRVLRQRSDEGQD